MKSTDALVREYLSHLRVEKGLSKNTTSAYERDLARFALFLEDREITADRLTAVLMEEFVATLRGKGGGATLA